MTAAITTRSVIHYILKITQQFHINMALMVLISGAWALNVSLQPYILKVMIDQLAISSGTDIYTHITFPAYIYILSYLIYTTSYRLSDYFVEIRMMPELRKIIITSCFQHLLDDDYTYHANNLPGTIINKVNDVASSIPQLLRIVLDNFMGQFLALLIAIYTLWHVHMFYGLAMLVWSCIFMMVFYILSPRLSSFSERSSSWRSSITGNMVDTLTNILIIKLFSTKNYEMDALTIQCDNHLASEQKLEWTYFYLWLCYGYSFVLLQSINLYLLIHGAASGTISTGDFVVVLTINASIVSFLWQLTQHFSNFSKCWGQLMQALRTLSHPTVLQNDIGKYALPHPKGDITFDDVSFQYPYSHSFIQNMSLTIKATQKVGLVGYSGSGKTTWINLLLGLYNITSGTISIDGHNIADITPESHKKAIAVIPQEPSLFHRSIMDNIRYGSPDATDEEVISAAKKAHAHHFIMKLHDEYNTRLGDKGIKLSGGQRQRIAIARAILKNAPILILDEATSQLDSITENLIQDSIWDIIYDKTTLVIAHRLSTLLHMDRILVFNEGRIIQDGNHKELIAQDGLYKKLWHEQVNGFLPHSKKKNNTSSA